MVHNRIRTVFKFYICNPILSEPIDNLPLKQSLVLHKCNKNHPNGPLEVKYASHVSTYPATSCRNDHNKKLSRYRREKYQWQWLFFTFDFSSLKLHLSALSGYISAKIHLHSQISKQILSYKNWDNLISTFEKPLNQLLKKYEYKLCLKRWQNKKRLVRGGCGAARACSAYSVISRRPLDLPGRYHRGLIIDYVTFTRSIVDDRGRLDSQERWFLWDSLNADRRQTIGASFLVDLAWWAATAF